jgi:(2Fe-2S) ferredoxin
MAIKDLTQVSRHLFLCNGGSCTRKGADQTTAKIRECIKDEGLDPEVHTTKTYCNGRCDDGPVVIVMPEGVWYKNITPEMSKKFVMQQLVKGQPLHEHVLFNYGSASIHSDAYKKS